MTQLRKSSQTPRQFSPIHADFLRISSVFSLGTVAERKRVSQPHGVYTAGVDAVVNLFRGYSFQAAEADESERPGEANSVRR